MEQILYHPFFWPTLSRPKIGPWCEEDLVRVQFSDGEVQWDHPDKIIGFIECRLKLALHTLDRLEGRP